MRFVSRRSALQYPLSGRVVTALLDDRLPQPFLLAQGIFFLIVAPDQLTQDFVRALTWAALAHNRSFQFLPEPVFGLLKRSRGIEPLRHLCPVRTYPREDTEVGRYAYLIPTYPL